MIKIENCNNINLAELSIKHNNLNIVLAQNGTGKSTIAKALYLKSINSDLSSLQPFGSSKEPNITFSNPFSNIALFNDDYIKKVLINDEVMPGTYEVFIKTDEYEKALLDLNRMLKGFGTDILRNSKLNEFYLLLQKIRTKFTQKKDGLLSNKGIYRSIRNPNIFLRGVPYQLEKYLPFSQSENVINWIDWKHQGHDFDSLGKCPFCADQLNENYQTEKKIFSDTFSKLDSKNIIEMAELLDSLKIFLQREKFILLKNCIYKKIKDSDIEYSFNNFISELFNLIGKLEKIINFDTTKIDKKDIVEFGKFLTQLKINSDTVSFFQSRKTRAILDPIDKKIDLLNTKTQELLIEISRINSRLANAASESQKDINNFLANSGINYEISISMTKDKEASTTLNYVNRSNDRLPVSQIQNHLSWGEKNAFALVLFMHFAISQNADLIILDDPVSSYDDDKKYAIINRLFVNKGKGKKRSLFKRTVLLFTHDLEPLIDFLIKSKPVGTNISATFIKNVDGIIVEQEITRRNLISQHQINWNIVRSKTTNTLIRLIALRKYIEYLPENSSRKQKYAYHLISSLLKEKPNPDKKIGHKNFSVLTPYQIQIGTNYIKSNIETFDYSNLLLDLSNSTKIIQEFRNTPCPFYKLQLFRILLNFDNNKAKITNDAMLDFINETYHIENDYFYTLDFTNFDLVPQHFISKCSEFINRNYT